MTSPKHAKQTSRGRQYINPITGQTYPSVTTILGQIGKAEALKWWAAAEVARYAVEKRDTWSDLDAQAAIDLLKREPLRSLNRAADRGTDVHAIADTYAQQGFVSDMYTHQGYVQAMLRFFHDHQPQPVLAEQTVYAELGYAGSFDMVCKLPAFGDALTILDYKTSKAIYPDTAAQLAAYANAEQYLDDHDQLHPMLRIKHGVVVRFGADGDYEVKEMDLTAGWELFKAAHAVYTAQSNQLIVGDVQPVPYDNSATRANITERARTILAREDDHAATLRATWIPNLPPLTSDQPIERHQLHLLDRAIGAVETKLGAPFNPPPTQELPRPPKTTTAVCPSEDIEVDHSEIDKVRALVNAAPAEVKAAIQATTKEAQTNKTTLSLNGKPTLLRVAKAHFMLDIYNEDTSADRDYMRAIMRHHNCYIKDSIGASLGEMDLSTLNQLAETHELLREGRMQIQFDNHGQLHIGATT